MANDHEWGKVCYIWKLMTRIFSGLDSRTHNTAIRYIVYVWLKSVPYGWDVVVVDAYNFNQFDDVKKNVQIHGEWFMF